MEILIFITGILISIWSRLKYKSFMCPCFIFIVFFTTCTLLGSLTLYGQNKASDYTYFLIWISLVSYTIAFWAGYGTKKVRDKAKTINEIIINKKLIYSIATISIMISSIQFIRAIKLLISGMNFADLRGEYFKGTSITGGSAFGDFLHNNINGGLILALMIIVTIEFYFNNKKDIKLIMLVLINVIMKVITTGGRLIMYDFILIIMFCYLYSRLYNHDKMKNNRFKIRINTKKILKVYLPILIIGLMLLYFTIILTKDRQGSKTTFNSIYDMFTIFLPLMDKVVGISEFNGDITYGITSFGGIVIIINALLAVVGLPQITAINTINIYDLPFLDIGGGNVANAYVSYIFYFYLDGRILGVILGNIFFGVLSARIYKNIIYNSGKKELAYYLFLIYIIFRTVIRWQFFSAATFITLLTIKLIYNSKIKCERKIYE